MKEQSRKEIEAAGQRTFSHLPCGETSRDGDLKEKKMKPRFSLEKHQEVGKELKVIRDYLVTLTVEINNAYPLREKVSRRALKACNAIDELRSSLDGCFCGEYPREDYRGIYYGPSEVDFRRMLTSSKQKDTG